MPSTIVTKNSSTASAVPLTGDLTQGELAVNVTDKRLFTKDSGGTVVELGINPSSLTVKTTLKLSGSTSGFVALQGAAAAGSTTYTLPSADGTNGQALVTNGTGTLSFSTVTTAAGGSNTQVQYNNSGAFAGSANFTFNGTTVTMANDAYANSVRIGKGAGSISTNTVMGVTALASNTTGSYNTAGGYNALNANTTSALNTAFGALSLQLNTGSNNTAIGADSLPANTTGSYNTAVGNRSLWSNTTASNNTAVGYQAAYSSNSTGGTYLGYQTGYSTTSGTYNTFVGYQSGYLVTTGAKNVILGGYNGNQGSLDIRTASNYIVLSDGDGNPRGIFNNSGNFLVGTTTNGAGIGWSTKLAVDASGTFGMVIKTSLADYETMDSWNSATSGTRYHIIFRDGSGATMQGNITTNGSSTSYNTTSDYRLKHDIAPMTSALAKVAALKPVTYKWNSDDSNGEGFIAHELAEVCPQAVIGKKDAVDEKGNPKYQSIDTSFLVATLTAAIQELKSELDAAKTEIETLKGQV